MVGSHGRWQLILVVAMSLSCGVGCSMAKFAASSTADVLWEAGAAVQTETDPILAEAAIMSNLKMFDGLLLLLPDNSRLLKMSAEAYSAYAFGYLQARSWEIADFDDPYLGELQRRIKDYHQRAAGYAWRLLKQEAEEVWEAIKNNAAPDDLDKVLAGVDDPDALDAMYWYAHCNGLLIEADTDDLENVARMDTVRRVMERVAAKLPKHEYGMPNAFLAGAQSSLGAGIAGDLEGARKRFESAIAVTEGRFLLPRYLHARLYCPAVLDRACFDQGMEAILAADPQAFPQRSLTNLLVQRWARFWKRNAEDLF